MRNLIRHQAAFYLIDEMGIELRKVVNATKPGSVAYLERLIGSLLSLYSTANGFALLSGDVQQEPRGTHEGKGATSGRSRGKRRQVRYHARRLIRVDHQLDTLDQGLDRRFLSLMGSTTPVTFDAIMDEEQATMGVYRAGIACQRARKQPTPKEAFQETIHAGTHAADTANPF